MRLLLLAVLLFTCAGCGQDERIVGRGPLALPSAPLSSDSATDEDTLVFETANSEYKLEIL